MKWADIQIQVPQEFAETAEAIAVGISGSGVYIEDYADLEQQAPNIAPVDFIDETLLLKPKDCVIIHMYLPVEEDISAILELLQGRLNAAEVQFSLDTFSINQEDWESSWKKHYHSFIIGKRLLVCPAWEVADNPENRTVLTLDPGMAFGTGTHETTELCLAALDEVIKPNHRVLDIGCGSGILGIAACLLGATDVSGVDIDPVAVRTAKENAGINGVKHIFNPVLGNLSETANGKYDVIAANIVANAIIALAPSIPPLLKRGGVFISSGIIDDREADVAFAIQEAGLIITNVVRKNGWVCIWAS